MRDYSTGYSHQLRVRNMLGAVTSFHMSDVNLHGLIALDDGLPVIQDVELFQCILRGPIVLVFGEDALITECTIDPTQMWPMDAGREYSGSVLLRRAVIRQCSFWHVGFAASHEQVQAAFESAGPPAG
jgi:hypothetical protein